VARPIKARTRHRRIERPEKAIEGGGLTLQRQDETQSFTGTPVNQEIEGLLEKSAYFDGERLYVSNDLLKPRPVSMYL